MEKCFLFDKENEKVKKWIATARKNDEDHEKIIKKTAILFGLENNDTTVLTVGNGMPIINYKIAKEKGFANKLKEEYSQDFAIHDNTGNYLGQWAEIKRNRKEYKEIVKFIDSLNLYRDKYGRYAIPNINEIILGDINVKGNYYMDYNYGIFFILKKENDFENENFKEAFKDAKEIKMSEFYKIKELKNKEVK